MKNYRASKQSDKEKPKNNAYMKKYRDVRGTLKIMSVKIFSMLHQLSQIDG